MADNLETALYVVATPIGNLNEISKRVLDALNECEYVFCEDTRVTGQLLAHLQIKSGAKGMTCAKLSEAIDLVDCGIEDILIANQITEPRKIRRLADLAGDCRLTVCVDNKENIKLGGR